MNYIKIQELSTAIVEYQTALDHIQKLAGNMVFHKTDMDIEITIKESIPETSKVHGMGNCEQGVDVDKVFHVIFGQTAFQYQPPPKEEKYIRSGLSQNKMPAQVALIMLGSIRKWYQENMDQIKAELDQELRPKQITLQLKSINMKQVMDNSPA